jgi:hypothetical protein
MIRPADITKVPYLNRSSGPGLFSRIRRHFAQTAAAMEGQARRAALKPDMLCDSGLSPEDLTDAPSHDPALPFFMQSHFGRDRR